MPTAPEICHRRCLIRAVKVLRQGKSEQHGNTNGHICVAREICVYLHRIPKEGTERFKSAVELWVVKDAVNELNSQVISQKELFQKTVEDPEDAQTGLLFGHLVRLVQLRDKFRGTDNRPSHQLREEAHVEAKVQDVLNGLDVTPVDVHTVADRLEGKEADSDRQKDLLKDEVGSQRLVGPQREGVLHGDFDTGEVVNKIGHEVGIFEIA